ncbi:MAG: VIT domain-containing protein, partial [Planctomycetia bacterium]
MPLRLLRVACVVRLACLLLLGLALAPAGQAAPALGDEGRVGVVSDRQGLCFVRPAGRTRWTPLAARAQVYPGDRIRTEVRGAHALELRLAGGARFVLGPGALLDVLGPQRLELLEGEAEASASAGAPLVVALAGTQQEVRAVAWLRAREGRLEALPAEPRWLAGWRAGTSDEWMGSLLVSVDGKQVPLHVGWHKVDVEVRDQVARTTVEQAFVNDTDQRLEGVFRFPLPAEASISGFGMWIGGELVEADVVERERARQVYEDILRRKKDPGLLEWAGGNLFQARVFPIEPRSEKRVRLRYTEVLPLEGGAWRYRYALQSELLRQQPLRELAVNVRVTSTQALSSVTCPTHPDARISAGSHEASLELMRRDTSPTSDLEVVGTVAPGAGVTPVAHCRDGEGWFMLLVRPPEPAEVPGARALVPEGTPLDLLLAVDTSGSLAGPARKAQEEFLATLLGLLGPGDRVRLCTLDTQVRWLGERAEGASPGLAARARAVVEQRPPRGWSDLDTALEVLLAAASPGTQVVYVGDGIPTRGEGDAVALAQRIRAAAPRTPATFHAVVPGNAYERGVLEALASLGGGSVRHLREDAGHAAERLLEEMALPGLKDLRVEVAGVPVARVYPARLPNLPAGGQHVILGRLQPGAARTAQVAVSGSYQRRAVRLEAALDIPAPGEGNSFLPRLWARRHIDALLEQGATAATKQQVIEASIEHTILTPYTSLLVLESDEDRERYGIERRVKARDGEVEFASTRDVAALEASRRALEQAQGWRLRLKRQMLQEIAGLGRDLPLPVPEVALVEWLGTQAGDSTLLAVEEFERAKGMDSGREGYGRHLGGLQQGGMPGRPPPAPASAAAPASLREERKAVDAKGEEGGAPGEPPGESDFNETSDGDDLDAGADGLEDAEEEGLAAPQKQQESLEKAVAGKAKKANSLRRSLEPASEAYAGEVAVGLVLPWEALREGTLRGRPDATALGFPARGDTAWDAPPAPEPAEAGAGAREVLARLLEPGEAAAHLRLQTRVEGLRPRDGRVLSREDLLVWRAPAEAYARRAAAGLPAVEHSLEAGRLTRLDAGSRLARAWEAGPHAALTLDDLARTLGLPTARDLEGSVVTLGGEAGPDELELVVARPPSEARSVLRLRRADGALLVQRWEQPGEPWRERRYSQHVSVAGRLWPQQVEQVDGRGQVQWRLAARIESLAPQAWAQAVAGLRAAAADAIVLGPKAPTLREARERVARGTAGLEERIVLVLDRLSASRGEEAQVHLEAALAGQPAVPAAWLRGALQAQLRDAAALAQHLEALLRPQVEQAPAGRRGLAERLLSLAGARLGPQATLALLQGLSPKVLGDEESDPSGAWAWAWREVDLLRAAGQPDAARARTQALAAARPDDLSAQLRQAGALREQGEPDRALAHLEAALGATPWLPDERDALVDTQVELLRERMRHADLEALLARACSAPEVPARRWVQWQSLRYLRGAEQEADAWLRATLAGAARGPQSTPQERAALEAALDLARGQGYGFWSQAFAPLFADALLEAVRFHAGQADPRRDLALSALGDWRVSGLAAAEATRAQLRTAATQPQALAGWSLPRLEATLFLVGWQAQATPEDLYQRVLAALEARRQAAPSTGERDALAALLQRLAAERGDRSSVLAVARRQREAATGRARPAAAQALLEALLESPHASALEDEALALVVELAGSDEPAARPSQ